MEPINNAIHFKCRLANRQEALVELGIIQSPEDLGDFAHNLSILIPYLPKLTDLFLLRSVRKSFQEQSNLFARLDEHAAKNQ